LLTVLFAARRTGFFAAAVGALGNGCCSTGPFSVCGVRIAPALENPPPAPTLGGITITLAGWFGCTRE
jgi:hypothetical protein